MPKLLKFNEKALKAMLQGAQTLARAVSVTLGPKGRHVVIKKEFGSPILTKDGATVASEITLKDKFENLGSQLIKMASSKTAEIAGDGTTTAVVLAEALIKEGVKNVLAGMSANRLKKGMEKALKMVLKNLSKEAFPIKTKAEILQIATLSANGDQEIGQMIADAMEKVGKDGIITIDEAKGIKTELSLVEGMEISSGYLSPYFVTNAEKMTAEMDKARIFITDKKLSSAQDIVPILQAAFPEGQGVQPLLLIAEEFDSEALTTLVLNKIKGALPIAAIKAPGFGESRKAALEDLAILTKTTIISEENGYSLEHLQSSHFGSAKKISVAKDKTVVLEGQGDLKKIKERSRLIKQQLQTDLSEYEKKELEKRLARLSGGVAVIFVGAPSEAEMKEKKDRFDDALHATKAAALEGAAIGGGVALLRAVKGLEIKAPLEEKVGFEMVIKACFKPAVLIAQNAGRQGEVIAEKVFQESGSFGYNALKDLFEKDLIQAGVIDPVLVIKSALQNAVSIASMLISAAVAITDKPEKHKPKAQPMMDGMNGMGGMGDMF